MPSVSHRRRSRGGGFTLLEIMVVVAIVGIVALFGLPALQNFIARSKIEGLAHQASVLMHRCRSEAIKQSAETLLTPDVGVGTLVAYADIDGDRAFTSGVDQEVGRIQAPSGVSLSSPDSVPVEGLTTVGSDKVAIFNSDGSIDDIGAVRFGDLVGNYLEVRIITAATARIVIKKWDGAAWWEQGENGNIWEFNG